MQNHPLSSLLEQLGLASSQQDTEIFINKKGDDANWAEIADHLDVMLRS